MRRQQQPDEIGKWSEDKLELLKKYLEAYTQIMKGQSWCKRGYHYIDAFAGTGEWKARDEQRYIQGSPRVALTITNPFTTYTFIEIDGWRVAQLNALKQEFSHLKIDVYQQDCNQVITTRIVPHVRYELFNRGIVFLDPYSMNVEWSTIQSIAETRALEIFINFPIMAINRTVLMNNPQKLDETKIERMNRFWGTEDWHVDIYQERPTLFGVEIVKVPQTAKSLSALFQNRLRQVFPRLVNLL